MSTSPSHVCAPFAEVLAVRRLQINARVAEARRRQPTFDDAAFAAFLRTGVDAVVQGVAAVAPQRVDAVAVAACDVALELVAHGLAGPGARTPWVERGWAAMAGIGARHLAEDPAAALGALSNALVNLSSTPGARPHAWLDQMVRLTPHAASLSQWRLLGQVIAWRAGMPHYRDGALQAADALPPPLALQAVGAGSAATADDWPRVRDAYRADPWWCLEPARREVARTGIAVGAFTGFGGRFAQPPQLAAAPQGFVVKSGERFSFLVADVHGAVLLASSADEFLHAKARAAAPMASLRGTRLTIGARAIDLPYPEEGLSIAENAHTVAVATPYRHAVLVFPRS